MERLTQIQITISVIALFAPMLPLITGGVRLRRLSPAQKATFFLIFSFILISALNYLLGKLRVPNLLVMYHVYSLIEFFGYLIIYSLPPQKVISRRMALVLGGVLLGAFGVNFLLGGKLSEMPSLLRTTESILLTGIAGFYLVSVFREMKVFRLEKEFLFWLSIAILIMFLGNLLLEMTGNQFLKRYDVYYDVWTIKNLRELIAYPLIAIGLLCKDPQKTS